MIFGDSVRFSLILLLNVIASRAKSKISIGCSSLLRTKTILRRSVWYKIPFRRVFIKIILRVWSFLFFLNFSAHISSHFVFKIFSYLIWARTRTLTTLINKLGFLSQAKTTFFQSGSISIITEWWWGIIYIFSVLFIRRVCFENSSSFIYCIRNIIGTWWCIICDLFWGRILAFKLWRCCIIL